MTEFNVEKLVETLSSITETSDVFIKDIPVINKEQLGGGFLLSLIDPLSLIGLDANLAASVFGLTVCCTCCSLICFIAQKSMCPAKK
jgi:hypothetical protein